MPTHYETLGVKRGCSPDEVRSAYRKLVLVHHPDRSSDPASRDIFIKVTEAYGVLSDTSRRQDYDRMLSMEAQRQQAAATAKPTIKAPPQPRVKTEVRKSESIAVELTKLVQLFSRGKLVETEEMARSLMKRAPREAIPYGVMGDILRSRGNLVEAAKMYAYAAQFDPRNANYQRRHEELISATNTSSSSVHIARDRQASATPPIMAVIVAFLGGIYLVLSREMPIASSVPFISTYTLGLVGVLFFTGIATGASLAAGGWLDRYEATTTNALGKRSPTVVLGYVAILNFWAAPLLYLFIGFAQRAFNYSTSRVVGGVAFLTILFSVCAFANYAMDATQVLAWGGNVIYAGSLLGWMVADAFRR